MKKLMAMILTLAMVMSLCVVPASAAGSGVTITITPDKSSVDTATGDAVVTYTVKAKVTDSTLKVGALTITLNPSTGLTLAEKTKKTESAFYYEANSSLFYHETFSPSGIFDAKFDYAPKTKTFVAAGATLDRNLNSTHGEVVLMTIMGKIAQGTTGTVTLGTTTCTYGDVMAEASHNCDVTPATVTITKAPISSVSASVNVPTTGKLLDFTGTVASGAPYSITKVEWFEGTNASGTSLPNPTTAKSEQFYYARITLTANSGETFDEKFQTDTVNGDYSVTRVSDTELTLTKAYPATGNKTLNGIDIITNPALTLAVPTAAPNATATNERSLAVTGVYDDGSGGPVEGTTWKITTDPIPKGVSLDGCTLKVTNEAEAGKVRIEASYTEEYTDAEFVTITKETPKETAIVATAPTSTTVAVPKNDTPNKIDLPAAAVYDQYGRPMTGTVSITYEFDGTTPTGVTLAPGYGKIEVDRTAQAGAVNIVAKLGTTLTSDPVTYTITRETSKVTSVRVNAPEYIMNVPKVTEPGTPNQAHQQFNAAKVLDQYGQEMTGQTVTWNVTDDAGKSVTGVSIDNNGLLTVTNEAPAITVYVTATCSGIVSNKSKVTINKEPAKATLVEICDQAYNGPETSLHIPAATFTNSEAYTAKVYDQYGVYMPSEMVHWALNPITVNGVELDTTTSTGNAILKVDSTAAPGTTFKLKATTATPDTTGVKELDITLTNKTPASVTAVPAAKTDLFYNGTDQALVTAGTASGGTMQYSLDGTTWSPDVPTGKDVGAYTVQYKVVGDANHTDTAPEKCQLVMISPKFLTKDNLTPTGSTSKVYDGTTNSSITVGVKEGVLFGSDTLTITGTAVYNSADVNEANTITFTPNAITTGNYRLANTQVLTITDAKITPRDLTVTPNAGQSKKFGAVDPTLHSTNSGGVPGQIPDFTGALSRAEGENVGQYDITLGTLALMDHFSSGFKASNYTLKLNSTPVKFEITKADAPTLKDITDSQKYTVTSGETAIGTAGMPADAGTLTYAKGTEGKTGSVTVTSWDVDSTGKVTYTLSGGVTGDTVTLPVIIKSTNYADATVKVVITLTAKDDQAALTLTGGTTVVYGQTLQLGTSGGSGTGAVTYAVTNGTGEATIDAASGKLTPVKVGTVKVKATKAADASFNEATSAEVEITINRATPTGEPAYTKITTSGKTLADAGLTTAGSTLNPNAGTLEWVDDAGTVLPGTTTVAANTTYKWRFTPTDTNYETLTGSIELYHKSSSSGGGGSYTPSYTVSVDKTENGTITVSPKSASKGDAVTITVKPDKGYELDTLKVLDKDGDKVKITEKNGKYTFTMPASKVTVKGKFVEEAPEQIFADVPVDAYCYEAVKWAASEGITGGIGNNLFAPGRPCTRGQIVTFLWRAAGSPAPKSMSSFADVPADAYYAKAVAWAVENGITGGTGDGKFSPDATCTRAQAVTFLYRASGSPAVIGSATFSDVAANAYYADAVKWAEKNGITGGIGGGLFGSDNDCTRAQIVTFLYRSVK